MRGTDSCTIGECALNVDELTIVILHFEGDSPLYSFHAFASFWKERDGQARMLLSHILSRTL